MASNSRPETDAADQGLVGSPLVSIITPTFNQGAFIERTITSVRDQTYPRFEHIVLDGGSRDGTLDILRRYEGTYPLRWASEPDRGMYDAINKGLRRARGEIVAYLNSDDLYFPWTLEVVINAFAAHPGSDIVFGDAVSVEQGSRRVRPLFQPPFRRRYLLTIGSFAQPATFWRREVSEQAGGFDASLDFVGDLDFFIRATRDHPALKIDEVLAVMRRHPAMKTTTGASGMQAENRFVRERQAGSVHGAAILAEKGRAWLARRRLWLRFALSAGRPAATGRPWSRFLEAGEVRLSYPYLLLSLLPAVGSRFADRSTSTGVDWLMQGAGSPPETGPA